jgi:hypothetical protein
MEIEWKQKRKKTFSELKSAAISASYGVGQVILGRCLRGSSGEQLTVFWCANKNTPELLALDQFLPHKKNLASRSRSRFSQLALFLLVPRVHSDLFN